MAKIVIFGATQMAKLTYFYLTHDSPHEVAAFTVDRDYMEEETLFGLPVVPFEEVASLYPPRDYKMLAAIFYNGQNRPRAQKYYEAKAKGYELISYVSSRAVIWPGQVVGDNCFIGEGSFCAPSAVIGSNVVMFPRCSVGYGARIKDHCYLAQNAVLSDGVILEDYCFVGGNATITDNITVAQESVIGAGALITENTWAGCVYPGNPSRPMPMRSDKLKRI